MTVRSLLLGALVLAVISPSVQAETVEGPIPVWLRSDIGRGQSGQGVVVQGRDACVVITAKHLVTDASQVTVRTDQGEHTAIVAYEDPALDFAILQISPAIDDCAPIESPEKINAALRKGVGLIWSRAETGLQVTQGVSLAMIDDRVVRLNATDPTKGVKRGMSGAAVAFDGVPVAIVLSAEQVDGRDAANTLRLDYIARLSGKRLKVREAPLTSGAQPVPPAPKPASELAPTAKIPTPAELAKGVKLAGGLFIWPTDSRKILAGFVPESPRGRNDGLNIAAPAGAPVYAVANGEVVYAGDQVDGFGQLILIKHAEGWVSAYAHLSRIDAELAQTVRQGDIIGAVGQTGAVTIPQLHFELRYAPTLEHRARPVSPALLLPPGGAEADTDDSGRVQARISTTIMPRAAEPEPMILGSVSGPLRALTEASTGVVAPEASSSTLYAYDDTHGVREGIPGEGHAYKYTPLGCDWRANRYQRISCSLWIEADANLMLSRVTNRPQLEMADGSLVPAEYVALSTDQTGPGYKGVLIADFYFRDARSKGLLIDAQSARSSVLLHIGFPTLDVANAHAVLFSIGAGDKVKRVVIVRP